MVEKIIQSNHSNNELLQIKISKYFLRSALRIPNTKYFTKYNFKTTKLAKLAVLSLSAHKNNFFFWNFNDFRYEFSFKQGYWLYKNSLFGYHLCLFFSNLAKSCHLRLLYLKLIFHTIGQNFSSTSHRYR